MPVYWQLRYRSPLSPTKGVDDVRIRTKTDHEATAERLAHWWLAKHRAHPSTRFIFVRPDVVATEEDMDRDTAAASPAA